MDFDKSVRRIRYDDFGVEICPSYYGDPVRIEKLISRFNEEGYKTKTYIRHKEIKIKTVRKEVGTTFDWYTWHTTSIYADQEEKHENWINEKVDCSIAYAFERAQKMSRDENGIVTINLEFKKGLLNSTNVTMAQFIEGEFRDKSYFEKMSNRKKTLCDDDTAYYMIY